MIAEMKAWFHASTIEKWQRLALALALLCFLISLALLACASHASLQRKEIICHSPDGRVLHRGSYDWETPDGYSSRMPGGGVETFSKSSCQRIEDLTPDFYAAMRTRDGHCAAREAAGFRCTEYGRDR